MGGPGAGERRLCGGRQVAGQRAQHLSASVLAGQLNETELGSGWTWWDVSADGLGLASGRTDCLRSGKDPSPQDVTVCQGETVAPWHRPPDQGGGKQ